MFVTVDAMLMQFAHPEETIATVLIKFVICFLHAAHEDEEATRDEEAVKKEVVAYRASKS
jgi:hypothetical protein